MLELHFWPLTSLIQKETGAEERLLIFPISYHEKSCSDIQQAETKEHVSAEKFAMLKKFDSTMQRSWRGVGRTKAAERGTRSSTICS